MDDLIEDSFENEHASFSNTSSEDSCEEDDERDDDNDSKDGSIDCDFAIEEDTLETEFNETHPYLTKYEKARLLGVRAEQIAIGSKVFVKTLETDPFKIALEELLAKKMPLSIKRIYHKKEIVVNVNNLFLLD